ncbi:MAG: dihydroorotase family protein [Candidatus Thermoplasmatota archaeon]|nr:dihydroorotase family protein [Candidatus Thermoplasmatota archaeon]
MDLVIEGNLFIDGGIRKGCVGIDNGRIASIKKILEGDKHLDFGEKLIFPTGLDVHVHFREPGHTEKEDFFTGTKAAALGGITFVMDMPNNKPPAMSCFAIDEKIRIVRKKACIDFALYGGIGRKSNVKMMAKRCKAFKTYLSGDNEIFTHPAKLRGALHRVKESGKVIAIHAESRECIKRGMSTSLSSHEKSRPVKCEIETIKKILNANKGINANLHICHVSSPDSIMLLKENGINMGVTPHHMLLSTSSKFKLPAMGKVNPPLRKEEERKKIFNLVKNGFVDIIESDHAPHLPEEKDDFAAAPSGMPGVDTALPLMLEEVKKGDLPLSAVHRMLCKMPAETFGINKGKIEVGRDADLLVIDFKEGKITPQSKCGWSSYEDRKGIYPLHVFLRGKDVVENGQFIGNAGMGEMIA